MPDIDRLSKALPWTIFAPLFGGLGIGHLVRGERLAGWLRLAVPFVLIGLLFMVFVATFPASADGVELFPAIYVSVWLFDVIALVVKLVRNGHGRIGPSIAAGIGVCILSAAWSLSVFATIVAQPPTVNFVFGLAAIGGSGLVMLVFLHLVVAPPKEHGRRPFLRVMLPWLAGVVGILGVHDMLKRNLGSAFEWTLVGLPLFVLAMVGAALQVWLFFAVWAALYLGFWGFLLARISMEANMTSLAGEPVGTDGGTTHPDA